MNAHATPRFRIEHRREGHPPEALGHADRPTILATLRRHAERLRAEGATGRLVLVDRATDAVVAWLDLAAAPWPLGPSPR
jgi:hypothetical protein